MALCIYEIQNIILDTTIYWTLHRSEHQGMAKKTFKFAAATLWNSLPDHFRTENSFSRGPGGNASLGSHRHLHAV
jgi:hemerythrin